jgi:cell division protein FtsL
MDIELYSKKYDIAQCKEKESKDFQDLQKQELIASLKSISFTRRVSIATLIVSIISLAVSIISLLLSIELI